MKKRPRVAVAATAVLLLACVAVWICRKFGANEGGRLGLAVATKLVRDFAGSFKPSADDVPSTYDATPAPRGITEHELHTALNEINNSLFFLAHAFGDHVNVECDKFLIPNGPLAEIQTDWTALLTTDGRNVLRKPTAAERESDAMFDRTGAARRLYMSEKQPKLAHAEGSLLITVPTGFAYANFGADEIEAVRHAPPMDVTLLRCENDLVALRIFGLPKAAEPVLVLRDRTGRRLMPGAGMQSRGDGLTVTCKTRGRIAKIELFFATDTTQLEIPVRATAWPDIYNDNPRHLPAARYMPETRSPDFAWIDADSLRTDTQIVARRSYAMFGFNTPEIQAQLPHVDNSAFAEVRFGTPTLLDAHGKTVAYTLEAGVYEHKSFSDEIRFTRDGQKKPLNFARARGTVKIRYPVMPKLVALTMADPKENGLEALFQGPKIWIRGLSNNLPYTPLAPELDPVRAYDQSGRRLRKLSFSGNQYKDNVNWQIVAFWGEPTKVNIVTVSDWIEEEFPFDLPPAPKLPKSQVGTRPADY